jgi:hypothetical protein
MKEAIPVNDKLKTILSILFLVGMGVAVMNPITAQSISTADLQNPMPVSNAGGILGELAPTGTATVNLAATAVVCPTLPAGTRYIYVVPAAAVNFGPSTVVSGDGWPMIATGSYKEFAVDPLDPTPEIYFYPYASGTTPAIRVIAVRR